MLLCASRASTVGGRPAGVRRRRRRRTPSPRPATADRQGEVAVSLNSPTTAQGLSTRLPRWAEPSSPSTCLTGRSVHGRQLGPTVLLSARASASAARCRRGRHVELCLIPGLCPRLFAPNQDRAVSLEELRQPRATPRAFARRTGQLTRGLLDAIAGVLAQANCDNHSRKEVGMSSGPGGPWYRWRCPGPCAAHGDAADPVGNSLHPEENLQLRPRPTHGRTLCGPVRGCMTRKETRW